VKDIMVARYNDFIVIIFGRHTQRPHIEGGGKVMYEIAKAIADIGIETIFFAFNYRDQPYSNTTEVYTYNKNYREINVLTNFINRDFVLNTNSGALVANIIEIAKTPLYIIPEYIRYIKSKMRSLVFIGNANKHINIILRIIDIALNIDKKKILTVPKREELKALKIRTLKPDAILVTSRELAYIAKNIYKDIEIIQMYPPIDLSLYKPLNKGNICNNILSQIGADKILLYIGRVNRLRFPLKTLKYISLSLKKIGRDAKLLIVTPPEQKSSSWIIEALNIIRKFDLKNVIILSHILTENEKILLYNCANVFVFPSITTTAIEPPLTVLEAVACGIPIVTAGYNSTREIAYATGGFVYYKHTEIEKILENVLSTSSQFSYIKKIREWAEKNLSLDIFRKGIIDILYKNLDGLT